MMSGSESRGSQKLALLAAVLLLLGIIPFLIWGAQFGAALSLEGARSWMAGHGRWAWAAGIALLLGDIALPIPGTVVMSALGMIYGWFLGGVVSTAGSMLSGITAFSLCRWLGRPAAKWIAGEDGLRRGDELFVKSGGWIVAFSRWLPVLPEAVSCLAGIARMSWRIFLPALACGSVPLGFAFAAIGGLGNQSPVLALALSAFVPVLLWLAAAKFLRWSAK